LIVTSTFSISASGMREKFIQHGEFQPWMNCKFFWMKLYLHTEVAKNSELINKLDCCDKNLLRSYLNKRNYLSLYCRHTGKRNAQKCPNLKQKSLTDDDNLKL
jgi:hypothetical protein